ncbi:MAG: G8 domain-containing protein [Planctomycetota bacterium]
MIFRSARAGRPDANQPPPTVEPLEPRVLFSAALAEGVLSVTGTDSGDRIAVVAGLQPGEVSLQGVDGVDPGQTFQGVDRVVIGTGNGNDVIRVIGDPLSADNDPLGFTVDAGNGNDKVFLAGGEDVVSAGNGKDVVKTFGGDDRVWAGAGNDRVKTGDGDDVIKGGKGKDKLKPGSGDDRVSQDGKDRPGFILIDDDARDDDDDHNTDPGGHHCTAHADDPVRAAEHCAAMRLATADAATHAAVTSGLWSDPDTWSNQAVPTDNADVHIPQGMTLTVDGLIEPTFRTLRIDGTLRFATDVDTQLKVDTVISSMTGRLEMGTAANPIAPDVTASIIVADTGAIDRSWDPQALSRGLVLHGSVEIHGAAKTSWTTAATAPRAGDTTLTLTAAPQGWRVGDTLAIAGTRTDATGDETATIATIDGSTVTLAAPLAFDHVPPADDLRVHVANTTRNAYIQSENKAVARRGHIMFMHNPDVHVAYAGFYDLGRTDKSIRPNPAQLNRNGKLVKGTGKNVNGRYSVHFHRHGVAGNPPAATVTGSALVGSPGWGYVNHSSHVHITDNVSYDVYGAAFYTEAGDEIGSFVNNLSIKTHGTGLPPNAFEGEDFGHSGDGFWFQGGGGVAIRGNVASGATGSGIIIYGVEFPVVGEESDIPFLAENLPDPTLANGAKTLPVGHTWLTEVSGSTAYGSEIGFQVYYHRSPISTDFEGMAEQLAKYQWDFPNSLIENTTVWNSSIGLRAKYNVGVHYKNVRIVNADDQPGDIGMDVANVYNNGEHIYENIDIRGFSTGLIPSPNGTVTINGGAFANEIDIYLMVPRQDHRYLDIRGDVRFLDLSADSPLDGTRRNVVASSDTRLLEDSSPRYFQFFDRITLNYGPFTGQQLYRAEQAVGVVPFPRQPRVAEGQEGVNRIPKRFLGLTNAQLQNRYGASLAGVLLPADAVDAPGDGIVGLIGSPSGPPDTLIPRLLLGSDDQVADLLV